MQGILTSIGNIFRFHKLKIVAVIFFSIFFAVLIFPYSDLADLMTVKVAEATNNQVYVQADRLSFSISPGLGAKLENVVVESPTLPPLKAGSISVAPSIMALITMSPNFSAKAEDIFSGNVDLSVSPGGKTRGGNDRHDIEVDAQQIALNALSEFLRDMNMGDLRMEGSLDVQSGMRIDPGFGDQPEGAVNLTINKFIYPARAIDMGLGPIQVPEVKLQQVQGKATMKDGRLTFEQLQLGSAGDELNGNISGDIGMNLVRTPDGNVAPQFGSYNLQIALNVSSNFQKRAGLFLIMADAYKKPTPNGYAYNFKVRGNNFFQPPQITQ
jgi:type II secretion system protein N